MNDKYKFDELIQILEKIKNKEDCMINIPKSLYTLALEIKKLEVFIANDVNKERINNEIG